MGEGRMIVVNEGLLKWFGRRHNQAKKPLESWLNETRKAKWQHLMDVRRNFPATDGGVKNEGYTIFDIKGNTYRLITRVDYKEQVVEIMDILTHTEYDRWNK